VPLHEAKKVYQLKNPKNMFDILTGTVAQKTLKLLLQTFQGKSKCPPPYVTGYFKQDDVFICFDNTSFCCFVEQASTEALAISWCSKEIEASELYLSVSEKKFD
jgi:hypothetical protein